MCGFTVAIATAFVYRICSVLSVGLQYCVYENCQRLVSFVRLLYILDISTVSLACFITNIISSLVLAVVVTDVCWRRQRKDGDPLRSRSTCSHISYSNS